jgi:hypothetical protein
VDGVWPPHHFRESYVLKTLEGKVHQREVDSYFMPCEWIHDVEIAANPATNQPAVTLFLASEYMVKPHAYVAKSMADYHAEHPDVKHTGQPLSAADWHEKLKALAAYLRRETATLCLGDIVPHEGEYAFFHVPR